jgi:hypothetical protein
MKVYMSLLAFAPENKEACVLTDQAGNTPTILLNDKSGETLHIVREALYNISGVSPSFYGHFNQAGFFEVTKDQNKYIYLIYTVYFPAIFDLVNQSYKWTKLSELADDGELYNIIRFIYGSRK